MKNIFLIASLLLSFNYSFANQLNLEESEIYNALIRCSDAEYYDGSLKNINKSFYSNNEVYISKKDELKNLKIKKTSFDDIYVKAYSEFYELNPPPDLPTFENFDKFNFQDYKKLKDEYEDMKKSELEPYNIEKNKLKKEIKNLEKEMVKIARDLTYLIVTKMSMKEKISNIPNYVNNFEQCENSFNLTPRAFILKWGDEYFEKS
tara:strand:+ start:607 stop:1221 length:615 start_codon:yes stop_codon:yes gene_type:complete